MPSQWRRQTGGGQAPIAGWDATASVRGSVAERGGVAGF